MGSYYRKRKEKGSQRKHDLHRFYHPLFIYKGLEVDGIPREIPAVS